MILSPCGKLNGLKTSQPIDLSLMIFDTDKKREKGEEWDFTWVGTGVTVSEASVHSLIKKRGYSVELVYRCEESKWYRTLRDP